MKTPRQSFDIDGCRSMLDKLDYEYKLCRSTDDRTHLSFHLVNFAMTAYHLYEWVLEDLEASPATKAKLDDECGLPPSGESRKKKFCSYVLDACPGLRICQEITNGTKHVEYDGPRAGHAVRTMVSAGPSFTMSGVPGPAEPSSTPTFTGTPKVIVNGVKSGDVRDIYLETLQWWRDFIYDHRIDRFNGPYSAA